MRAIDELATHILERAVADLRAGRISCAAFSMHDDERFGFAADFVGGTDLDESGAPTVDTLNDAAETHREPQAGDRCVSCSSTDLRDAGDSRWLCLSCNHEWAPFGVAKE